MEDVNASPKKQESFYSEIANMINGTITTKEQAIKIIKDTKIGLFTLAGITIILNLFLKQYSAILDGGILVLIGIYIEKHQSRT